MKGRSAFGVRRSAFGVRAFGGAMFSVLTRFEIGESLPGPDLL
jgi:hypothetical protein